MNPLNCVFYDSILCKPLACLSCGYGIGTRAKKVDNVRHVFIDAVPEDSPFMSIFPDGSFIAPQRDKFLPINAYNNAFNLPSTTIYSTIFSTWCATVADHGGYNVAYPFELGVLYSPTAGAEELGPISAYLQRETKPLRSLLDLVNKTMERHTTLLFAGRLQTRKTLDETGDPSFNDVIDLLGAEHHLTAGWLLRDLAKHIDVLSYDSRNRYLRLPKPPATNGLRKAKWMAAQLVNTEVTHRHKNFVKKLTGDILLHHLWRKYVPNSRLQVAVCKEYPFY